MNKSISQIEYFEKFGSIPGLERINSLLGEMNNPQEELNCIHIAGTNGKGSTARFIYSVLMEAGYSVGIYSSPFLEVFNERIEVNGQYISDEDLNRVLTETTSIGRSLEERGFLVPTEFDIVTAAAFKYFDEKKVDFVVLEVGLGGREDSTNVILNPFICAITSISLDHTDRLGETIREIAYEKGGIIKEGSTVVTGYLPKEACDEINRIAIEKNATLESTYPKMYDRESGIDIDIIEESIYGSKFKILKDNYQVEISMIGRHQIDNSILAISVLRRMEEKGVIISKDAYKSGLKKAFNKGRMEIISSKGAEVILDGAHNDAGMKAFIEAMKSNFKAKKLCIVIGVLEDKDAVSIAEHLKDLYDMSPFDIVVTEPDNPRKMKASKLSQLLENSELKIMAESKVDDIIKNNIFDDYDAVAFVGSLYLVGQVRSILMKGMV